MSKPLSLKQTQVLNTLNKSGEPMGAYEILDKLREDGFRAPLQVYRALDKLISLGRVHKLESLNAYLACQHDENHDSHETCAFAICDQCGSVNEVLNHDLIQSIEKMTKNTGFQVSQTTLELKGICADCSSKETS